MPLTLIHYSVAPADLLCLFCDTRGSSLLDGRPMLAVYLTSIWRRCHVLVRVYQLIPSPTEDQPHLRHFSLASAQSQHIEQLGLISSSMGVTYCHIKLGYACDPYIKQANKGHLRRIIAHFRTGSHWLNIKAGCHKKPLKQDRSCPICSLRLTNPGLPTACWDAFDSDESSRRVVGEHHAIFDCSG